VALDGASPVSTQMHEVENISGRDLWNPTASALLRAGSNVAGIRAVRMGQPASG